MVEAYVTDVRTELPGRESPEETRRRLRSRFPAGATRRMTQLGLLLGSLLEDLEVAEDDALVYASGYAENHALADYLASFPTPSPTLFQTAIHPSGVQQALVARQQAVREVFPLTGGPGLAALGARAALMADGRRVLYCGGEERGSWLREHGLASESTFAFALALARDPAGAIGILRMDEDAAPDPEPSLAAFAEALAGRLPLDGGNLTLQWR